MLYPLSYGSGDVAKFAAVLCITVSKASRAHATDLSHHAVIS